MGSFVIAAYRPRQGKEGALLQALRDHLPILREEGLATDRPPYVMRAADGTILEVFEWVSEEAVKRAHESSAVQALWSRFGDACEYVRLSALAECDEIFPHFEPIEL